MKRRIEAEKLQGHFETRPDGSQVWVSVQRPLTAEELIEQQRIEMARRNLPGYPSRGRRNRGRGDVW
jgi:hypothetical protein